MVDTRAPAERAKDSPSAAARRPELEGPAEGQGEAEPVVQQVLADARPGQAGAAAGGGHGGGAGAGASGSGAAHGGGAGSRPRVRGRDVVALQRMAGNSAVSGFLGRQTVVQRAPMVTTAPPSSTTPSEGDQPERRNPNIAKAILAWQQQAPAPGPLGPGEREGNSASRQAPPSAPAPGDTDAGSDEGQHAPQATTAPETSGGAAAGGAAVGSRGELAGPGQAGGGAAARGVGVAVAAAAAPSAAAGAGEAAAGVGTAAADAARSAARAGEPTAGVGTAAADAVPSAAAGAGEAAAGVGTAAARSAGVATAAGAGAAARRPGEQAAGVGSAAASAGAAAAAGVGTAAAVAGVGTAAAPARGTQGAPADVVLPEDSITAVPPAPGQPAARGTQGAPADLVLPEDSITAVPPVPGRPVPGQRGAAPGPSPTPAGEGVAPPAGPARAPRAAGPARRDPGRGTGTAAQAARTAPDEPGTAPAPSDPAGPQTPITIPEVHITGTAPVRVPRPVATTPAPVQLPGFRERRPGGGGAGAPGAGPAAVGTAAAQAAAPILPGAAKVAGAAPTAGKGAGKGAARGGGRRGGGGGGASAPKPVALNDPTLEAWRSSAKAGIDGVKQGDLGEAKDAATRVDAKGTEVDAARKADQPDFEADAKSKQPPMPQEAPKEPYLKTDEADTALQSIVDAGSKKLATLSFKAIDFSTMPQVKELTAGDFVPKTQTKAIADLEAKLAGKDLKPGEREALTKELEARKKKVADIEAHAFDAPAQKPPVVEPPAPASLEPIDPAQADLLGDAVARLLAKLPEKRDAMLTQVVTAMKGDKVPRAKQDADLEKPTLERDLEAELRGIADAAGVADLDLKAKVAEQKDQVKKEEEAVKAGVAASAVAATKKVEDSAAEQGKQIAGAKKAVDKEIADKKAAVDGPPDTAAIERKRDEYLGKAEQVASQGLASVRAAAEKRETALTAAASDQKGQVDTAVNNRAAAIRRHYSDDVTKGDVTARPTLDWGKVAKTGVDAEAARLKKEATAESDRVKADVTAKATAAKDSIRDWAAHQQGKERSWWDRLMDMISDWGHQADANNAAWEKQRNAETRDAMVKDFDVLTKLRETEQRDGELARDREISRLSKDQQALAKKYFAGGMSSLDFVAESTMARISGRRVPELAKKLEENAITFWTADELGQLARASNPKFNPYVLANKIRGAVAGPGTNEAQVFEGLGGARTAVERAALDKAYFETFGVAMKDDVEGDLGGHEKERAQAMMAGKSAEADAAALKEAMAGWGTDEDAIRNTLRGKSPEELEAIKAEYKRMYNVELKDDIDDDADDAEQDNLMALADGDVDKADAAELEDAMAGPGTDEQKIQKVYERIRQEEEAKAKAEGLSPAELQLRISQRNARISEKFKQYGDLSTKLTAEMADVDESSVDRLKDRGSKLVDTGDVKLIEALQSGDTAKIDAAKALREHESTYTSDDELEKIARNQAAKAELDVGLELASDKVRLKNQLESGDITYDEYKASLGKWEEKSKTKDKLVADKAKANMGALKDAYSAATGGTQSFDQLIEDETSGYSNWELRELVKAGGKLSDEDELYFATAGAGTDEDKIKEILKGKTPDEIAKIRKLYAEKHPGQTLDGDILEDLSGREDLDVGHMLEFGDPDTFAKQLADAKDPIDRARIIAGMRTVLEERKSFEETGLIGSIFAETGDPLNSADQMERALKTAIEYDRALEEWEKKNPGKKPEGDAESPELAAARNNMEMHTGGAIEAQEQVRAQIDSYADVATQAGAAIVGVAVTVATLGAAGPVVAALYGAAAAAAATMALKATLKGNAYSWEEMGVDLAIGVVDAGVSALTAGIGKGVMQALEKAIAAQVAKAAAKEGAGSATKEAIKAWAKEALEEAIENAIQAMPSAFVGALLDDNTWKSDDPWGEIGKATASAAGTGAAMGVGMKGVKDVGSAAVGAVKAKIKGPEPKVEVPGAAGKAAAEPKTGGGANPPEPKPVDLPPEATPAVAAEKAAAGELPAGAEGADLTKGGQLPDSATPDAAKGKAGADVDAEGHAKGGADAEGHAKGEADAEATGKGSGDGEARAKAEADAKAKAGGSADGETRAIDQAPPERKKAGGPSKDDVGKTLSNEDLAQRYGMPEKNVAKIQQVCDDLGIVVDVRPTTPYAEPMLRDGTALPKPEKVKAKTINETDVMIGLAKEGDLGKVGFFDPATVKAERPANYADLDPKTQEKIDKRIKQRNEEFADYAADMKKLQDAGLIRIGPDGLVVNTGLIPGGELPFTGDHDLFDIRKPNGARLSPAEYQAAKEALKAADAGIMHGAVTGWEMDSPETFNTASGQKSYGKMVEAHSRGGDEPIIRFGDGPPKATWYDPPTELGEGTKAGSRAAGRYFGTGSPDEEK